MKIGAYSPRTGNLLAADITGINFGNVRQGQHCALPILIRPEKEDETLIGLELFLQNNGGFNQSQFGGFIWSDFTQVRSWDPLYTGLTDVHFISDHFSVQPAPTGGTTGGEHISIQPDGHGDWVWLDVQAGLTETGGTSSVNYRFIFEYT
jgi:hypothetical protein